MILSARAEAHLTPFIGSRRGDFCIFAHGREKKLLNTIELVSPINATVVAANGTLYVATMKTLYAVKAGIGQAPH